MVQRLKKIILIRTRSIKIRVHAADPDIDPVVCSFPGGLPSSLLAAANGSSKNDILSSSNFLASTCLRQEQGWWSLIGKDDNACFESGSGTRKNNCRTKLCVGVYIKKEGKTDSPSSCVRMEQWYALPAVSVPSYLRTGGINVDSVKTQANELSLKISAVPRNEGYAIAGRKPIGLSKIRW
jgi:hypothetical protein